MLGLRSIFQFGTYSKISLSFGIEYPKTAVLTLNNQAKRNALCSATLLELKDGLATVHQSCQKKQTKILLLRAQGESVFSAGHDLKEIKEASNPELIFQKSVEVVSLLKSLPVPSICVINGQAVAAGLQIALACDIVLATMRSHFSTPGIKFGLFCSTPGVELVRCINSDKKANQMLLFGESITAQQAFQYGLINRICTDKEALEAEVKGFVEKTLGLSGEVLALGKKVLREQRGLDKNAAYCVAVEGMRANIAEIDDCKQGLTAFAEKRKPSFKQ